MPFDHYLVQLIGQEFYFHLKEMRFPLVTFYGKFRQNLFYLHEEIGLNTPQPYAHQISCQPFDESLR